MYLLSRVLKNRQKISRQKLMGCFPARGVWGVDLVDKSSWGKFHRKGKIFFVCN